MPKLLKWGLGIAAGLILIIVLAIIIVPMVVDPNDYREQITSAVKEQTGRELKLEGDLSVSVFPWAGVRTEGLSFSQPAQIGGDMLSVDTAQIRVKILPLISSRVEVDTIILKQPTVRLITLPDGTDSFAGLVSEDAEEEVADETAALAVVIQGLEITNGTVIYDDQKAGSRYDITDFNLVTGNLLSGDLASVTMSGKVADSTSPEAIEFSLDTQASIDTGTLEVTVRELKSRITQAKQGLEFGFDELKVQPGQRIMLAGLAVAAALENRTFNISAPEVVLDQSKDTASMPTLKVVSDDMDMSLSEVKVLNLSGALAASGKLSLPAFNAAKLLSDLGIDYPTADPTALTAVGLTGQFQAGTNSAKVSDIVLNLDDSTLSGNITIADIAKQAVAFALTLDRLDADRYLPPEDPNAVVEETGTGAEALAIPMDAFKDINVNGQFTAEQFIISGLKMNNIDVKIESTDNSLTITPKSDLYDGGLRGAIAYAEQGDAATLNIDQTIDLINLSPLLADLDVSDQLSGIATLNLDIEISEVDGRQSNSGIIRLQTKNGAMKGVDIKGILDTVSSRLSAGSKDKATGSGDANDETRFAEMSGTFYLKNNRLTNNDFKMIAPLFRINGEGVIDLAAETIDYRVDVSIVASSEGQGSNDLENLAGVTIPIKFSNNLYEPSYSLDMGALFGNIAKQKLNERKS
ncbi:MAG: AsmA family protein, partial [Gammaproteobacteria bacterium]|nr:AsmA family protein [Gammaproteobacteria bacterium]